MLVSHIQNFSQNLRFSSLFSFSISRSWAASLLHPHPTQ
jgi:hypothetical protein